MKTNTIIRYACIAVTFLISPIATHTNLLAQENKISQKDIPSAVLESFNKTYPNAKIIGFDIDKTPGSVTYEIESKDGDIQRDVEFTSEGTIVEIGEFISVNSVPLNIVNAIMIEYKDSKILIAEKKIRGSNISYEIVIENKNKKREVQISSNGVITKESIEGNDEEDTD